MSTLQKCHRKFYHFFNFLHLNWICQEFSLFFFLAFPSENKHKKKYSSIGSIKHLFRTNYKSEGTYEPDFKQGVFPDLGSQVEVGGRSGGVEDGPRQEASLSRWAALRLLILVGDLLVDGTSQEILISGHLTSRTLVHPVQTIILFSVIT